MSEVKQVIVFRKDLLKGNHAIRKGKFAAQCCHASLGALLTQFNRWHVQYTDPKYWEYLLRFRDGSDLDKWLNGIFTKICVSVDTEEELLALHVKAKSAGLPCALIQDAGLTEFHGVPTYTCLGIGPASSEVIDKLTGDLPLL